jgi:hypothetical protein
VIGLNFAVCVLSKRVVRRWLRRRPTALPQSAPRVSPRLGAMTRPEVAGPAG